MAKAREAISLLQMVLPDLPTGSSMHKAVLDSVSKLSKEFPASAAVPGVQKTALQGLAHRAKQDAMLQAVQRSMGGGQGGAGAPGLPPQPPTPAMPPPAAPMGEM